MLPWSLEHRVFAYDAYVKNGESVTETQRLFKRRFNIGRHGNVPSRNSILRWINALRTTGSLLKAKPPGPVRSARTSENVDRVREAITRSPRRSARRHSTELGISQSTMQRILHEDLIFQPYKIMTVQQLKPREYQQRLSFCQTMLDMFEENENLTLIMSDEAHFHIQMVQLTNKTFDIGLHKILVNCISDHYTVQKLLFGVVWEIDFKFVFVKMAIICQT